jgi:hypothetical protein
MSTRIFCDRCRGELKRNRNGNLMRYEIVIEQHEEDKAGDIETTEHFREDLCPGCFSELHEAISGPIARG